MTAEKIYKRLTLFLFIQIGIVYFLSYFPEFIEKTYSNGVYLFISLWFRTFFGWIPFSIGDLIYISIIILIIRFLYRVIKFKKRNLKQSVLQLFAGFSIFYFCFYLFWGLNYSRLPVSDSLALKTDSYNIQKLTNLTDKLLFNIKDIQLQITRNDSIAVKVPYSQNEILRMTQLGYKNLAKTFKQFQYKTQSLKKSLFSLPLTYMGFAGYYNPLSGEAQVDYLIPKYTLPMTCSHEVAHQLGIASESEANFIGFLAASHHDDLYFQYSAYVIALRYALSDIYRSDPKLYQKYYADIPKGILINFKETEEFWDQYENPFEPVFKIFYDSYLKVNQQKHGLKSYSKMIDLLIAYDNKYGL